MLRKALLGFLKGFFIVVLLASGLQGQSDFLKVGDLTPDFELNVP